MATYYPLQIPQLLSRQFRALVSYEEHTVPELETLALCVWTMHASNLNHPVTNRILPDGCIDLVIDFTSKSAVFSGQTRASEDFELSGVIDYLGVRLRPGMFYRLYGISATSAVDTLLPLESLPGTDRLEDLFEFQSTKARINRIVHFFHTRIQEHDPFAFSFPIEQILPRIYDGELATASAIATAVGYGPRQTGRLFHEYIGMGPKTFLNIVRLHEALHSLDKGNHNLTALAHRAGFADQSHFTREIKRYTGLSPIILHDELQERRRTA